MKSGHKTEFLTITSLSGQPLFCIAAGRQSDGQFRLRMRDNIRVRRSFACGHIANCIQNVLYGQLKEPKKEGNNANFCDKIFISLREKNEILKLLSNFAFLRTYVCSQGILKATYVHTFFIFAFAMQISFFSRPQSIDKCENMQFSLI